jgi:hypothetical protein
VVRRHFLIGAFACSALTLGGCDASGPHGGDTGSPTQKVNDSRPSAPPVGEIGTWELLNTSEVNSDSTTLRVGVTRLGCAGGVTGTVPTPKVQVEQKRILIQTNVGPLSPGAHNCQGNNTVPVTVVLNEPLGKRELVDAACLEGRAVTTSMCMDNGVRWRP